MKKSKKTERSMIVKRAWKESCLNTEALVPIRRELRRIGDSLNALLDSDWDFKTGSFKSSEAADRAKSLHEDLAKAKSIQREIKKSIRPTQSLRTFARTFPRSTPPSQIETWARVKGLIK